MNDPRLNKALRSYEQQFVAQRRLEEVQQRMPNLTMLPHVPTRVPRAPNVPAVPAWAKLLATTQYPKPQPTLGRHLGELHQINGFFSRIFETVNAFDKAVTPVVRGLVEGLRPVTDFLVSAGNFLDKLPNFAPALEELLEAVRRFEEAVEEGDATLEAAEYGFADHLWDRMYVASFAHVDPRVRDAVVTRKLAAATRADDFGDELRERFEGSIAMGRRWRAVEAAFEAHQRKEYLLSIPAMLPQVEGAIVDAMVLKDLAVKKNGKLYMRGEDGEPKLNKKGKPLPEVMLSSAVRNAQLEEHPTLEGTSSFVADSLIQKRNAVLHGRDLRYDRAKLSVQALLVLALLAEAVGEMEAAKEAVRN